MTPRRMPALPFLRPVPPFWRRGGTRPQPPAEAVEPQRESPPPLPRRTLPRPSATKPVTRVRQPDEQLVTRVLDALKRLT